MEVHKPAKRDYMAPFERYEPVIVDSSLIMGYKFCPTSYFFRYVLGFSPKFVEPYFRFGSSYHKFREVLEAHYRLDPNASGSAFEAAKKAGLDVFNKQGGDPPLDSKFAFMHHKRLEASFIVAMKHWLEEKKLGAIVVIDFEQPFALELYDGIFRAGRADQIVLWRGKLWGRDFKTSSQRMEYYKKSLEPNDQFTGYTWGEGTLHGKHCEGQIVEVLHNDKSNGPTIHSFTTTRTEAQLKEWKKEHKFWTDMMEKSREEDMYPKNEKSCTYCPFHRVCTTATESGKMSELKSNFKVEPWDCMKVNQGEG